MDKKRILKYFILLSNFIILFIFYSKIPRFIPTVFGINSGYSGFIPKISIFCLPVLNAIVCFIIDYASKYNFERNQNLHRLNKIKTIELISAFFIFYVTCLMVYFYIGHKLVFAKLWLPVLGVAYMGIAFKMTYEKRDHFISVRNRWTINHIQVWKKTCDYSRFVFSSLSLINFALIFIRTFNPLKYDLFTILTIISLHVYSFLIYKFLSVTGKLID